MLNFGPREESLLISWQVCFDIQYLLICQFGADVMNSVAYYLLIGVIAYLMGSIPVAYIIAKAVRSIDVRKAGEGNVGARNVFHTVGPGGVPCIPSGFR